MALLVVACVAVIVISAIFSGTEAALFSLSQAKAQGLNRTVQHLKADLSKPIASIVIGNNLANIVGTFFVAYLATTTLEPMGRAWLPWILTALIILFAEIIPKNFGEKYNVAVSVIMAKPVLLLTLLFTPAIWLIQLITKMLIQKKVTYTTDEEEIKQLAKIGRGQGVIDPDEAEMVEKVFYLDDTKAMDIMTPRVKVSHVRGSKTLSEVGEELCNIEHSRIVVIGETIDEVHGFVIKSHLLQKIVQNKDLNETVTELAYSVPVVRETMAADQLLIMFQKERKHLAVVQDGYGGVAGVVTLEDVIEVITGEIVDETDTVADLAAEALANGKRRLKMIQQRVQLE